MKRLIKSDTISYNNFNGDRVTYSLPYNRTKEYMQVDREDVNVNQLRKNRAAAIRDAIRAVEGDDDDYRMKILNWLAGNKYHIDPSFSRRIYDIVDNADSDGTVYLNTVVRELENMLNEPIQSSKAIKAKAYPKFDYDQPCAEVDYVGDFFWADETDEGTATLVFRPYGPSDSYLGTYFNEEADDNVLRGTVNQLQRIGYQWGQSVDTYGMEKKVAEYLLADGWVEY